MIRGGRDRKTSSFVWESVTIKKRKEDEVVGKGARSSYFFQETTLLRERAG